MKVEKVTAQEVFKDNNEGFIFGLMENSDYNPCEYVEWFKTEEEREQTIKENKMEVTN